MIRAAIERWQATMGKRYENGCVNAGAGYWYGSSSAAPKMVAVAQTGCGPAAASFGVPLETTNRGVPKLAASFGPIEIPAASQVRLHFDRPPTARAARSS